MIAKPGSTIRSVALVSEHASPCATLGGPDEGGQNVYIAGLATELGRRGIEVTVYTRRYGTVLPRRIDLAPGVVVQHIDAGPSRELSKDALLPHMGSFGAFLRSHWTVYRPDIVHAHYWMSGLASLAGVVALGIPFIQTFHALGIVKRRFLQAEDTSPQERIPAELQLARVADAVVATSVGEAHELARMGGLSDRMKIVPCGVNTEVFCPEGPTEQRMPGLKRIVMVGRLVRRKGVDEVVRALRMLPKIELVIVGGSGASDPDVDRIRALACREGVDGRVELRGPLSNREIPRVLRSADLVVCFPWYEPFGIVAIEAMACGRPLLASAVGGLCETVIDGRTGLLVAARDPEGLVSAVNMLLRDSARRAAMGQEARRRAVDMYEWRCVVDRILEIYASAIIYRASRVPLVS